MLLPSLLSVLFVTVSSTPLLQSEDQEPQNVAAERQFDLLGDTIVSDTADEYLDSDVDERLLTSGTPGLSAKGITYKTAGTGTYTSAFYPMGTQG